MLPPPTPPLNAPSPHPPSPLAQVSHIQRSTRIPVLGHADGICHVYVDAEADPAKALAIAVDSKADYPAACNAAETILVHASLADGLARELLEALKGAGVAVHAGPRAAERYGLERAASLRHEYSSLDVGFELVDDLAAAIDHIHAHGSSHTEVVVTGSRVGVEERQGLGGGGGDFGEKGVVEENGEPRCTARALGLSCRWHGAHGELDKLKHGQGQV